MEECHTRGCEGSFETAFLYNNPFTRQQRDIVREQFNRVSEKFDSKIEKIEFFKNYALIKILISVEVALQNMIDNGMNSCNGLGEFLRFHFYCTNVQKPTKKMIRDYLDEIAEKKAN